MLAAIRSAAAVTVYPFESAINCSDKTGIMTRDDSTKSFLLGSTEISTFTVSDDFLIVGCMTCDNNMGWIRLYTTDTLRLRHTIKGTDKNSLVGQHVETRRNVVGMNQLWFSSRYNDFVFLSTLLTFQDISTEKWEFYEESQLYSFPGATNDDSAEFSCYDKSCFFKSSEG